MGTVKFLVFPAVVQLMAATFAYATIPIIKIADTSTPDPSGNGDFTSFAIPSSDRDYLSFNYVGSITPNGYYDYNNIFFTAKGPNGLSGVYAAVFPSPGITEIVTLADTTMGDTSGGQLASFSNTTSGNSEAGFIASDSNGLQDVYEYSTVYGGPYLVATSSTSPVAGTTFGNFQSISFYAKQLDVDPAGEIESDSGIYDFAPSSSSDGLSFTLVANTSTIPPGASSPFTSFGPVSYKAHGQSGTTPGYASTERAVLATVGSTAGIYYGKTGIHATSAPLVKLVDTNSPVPGGTGDFTSFGNPIATATYIEFIAGYSSSAGAQQGIFAYGPYLGLTDVATLQEFLDTGTVAPDSGGAHFVGFLDIGNNQGYSGFLFMATLDNGQTGLYTTTGIDISAKILDTGDALDGKTVSSIELSPDSSGNVFTTFEAGFTDGSEGIYYFDTNAPYVPEPAIGLWGLATLLLIRRRSRSLVLL